MNMQETIAQMLTENTGTHFLDSGGANGRAWQQNAGKVVADFEAQPSATAEIYVREWQGKLVAEVLPCVNIFHLLTCGALELDDLCHEFNAMPVAEWGGDYNGVSLEGSEWLEARGFVMCKESRGGWNTYNWNAAHSQVMQGNELTLEGECGEEKYLLLQIHGGADVRGGYTDARLFKLADYAEFYNVVSEDCGFSDERGEISISWHGEWINSDGGCADDESDLLAFATACGASLENPSVTVAGDAYLDF
jgi:hypothetical protein